MLHIDAVIYAFNRILIERDVVDGKKILTHTQKMTHTYSTSRKSLGDIWSKKKKVLSVDSRQLTNKPFPSYIILHISITIAHI